MKIWIGAVTRKGDLAPEAAEGVDGEAAVEVVAVIVEGGTRRPASHENGDENFSPFMGTGKGLYHSGHLHQHYLFPGTGQPASIDRICCIIANYTLS